MLETNLQKKIIDELKKRGHYVINVVQASKKGVPDIIGCFEGKFYGLEVKLPGKESTLTKLQSHNLNCIQEAGGTAKVVTSLKDIEELFE